MTGLAGWLAGRTPPPPDALPLPVPEGAGDPTAQLIDASASALERALARGGERGGAFDLLAADGLITYACERAAAADDPEEDLLRILDRIGRHAG